MRLANRGDVVVVTINHRLNGFGHLYVAGLSNDPKFADSGNVGMLDIARALEWVRDNAAAIGGDAGNVTIFGESGSAAKVSTLMGLAPAQSLFQRAIAQSGSMSLAGFEPTLATGIAKDILAASPAIAFDLCLKTSLRMRPLRCWRAILADFEFSDSPQEYGAGS